MGLDPEYLAPGLAVLDTQMIALAMSEKNIDTHRTQSMLDRSDIRPLSLRPPLEELGCPAEELHNSDNDAHCHAGITHAGGSGTGD